MYLFSFLSGTYYGNGVEEIERDFNDKWNFPECCGAIDGKHIAIHAPANCGSTFYNYKKSNSIILMAVVGPNYQFIYIDVGFNGSYRMVESFETVHSLRR